MSTTTEYEQNLYDENGYFCKYAYRNFLDSNRESPPTRFFVYELEAMKKCGKMSILHSRYKSLLNEYDNECMNRFLQGKETYSDTTHLTLVKTSLQKATDDTIRKSIPLMNRLESSFAYCADNLPPPILTAGLIVYIYGIIRLCRKW